MRNVWLQGQKLFHSLFSCTKLKNGEISATLKFSWNQSRISWEQNPNFAPISQWHKETPSLYIHSFCYCQKVSDDFSRRNHANEWKIKNILNNYCLKAKFKNDSNNEFGLLSEWSVWQVFWESNGTSKSSEFWQFVEYLSNLIIYPETLVWELPRFCKGISTRLYCTACYILVPVSRFLDKLSAQNENRSLSKTFYRNSKNISDS